MSAPVPPNISSGPGKAFLICGTAVAAGLGGFYMNMLRKRHAAEERGENPLFEQVIKHGYDAQKGPVDETRQPLRPRASDIPPAFRRDEHDSGHSTHKNYKDTAAYAEHGEAVRRMVPPPQRPANDGTGRAYTKSPNYADNYGKTKRPPAVAPVAA